MRRSPLSLALKRWRKWRESSGLTQGQAAGKLGIDPWYLAKIEQGRRVPGRKTAVAMAALTDGHVDVAHWDREAA
jgi:DNA-binding XRE family transcriptional regulator